jgi:hypothetical protein
VQSKEPPPVVGTDAFNDFLGRAHPMHRREVWREADDVDIGNARALKEAEVELEKWERQKKTAKAMLCSKITDAEGIVGPFGKIAWRGVQGRESLDKDALIEDLRAHLSVEFVDQLVAKHTKRGNGYRRFQAYWKEESK